MIAGCGFEIEGYEGYLKKRPEPTAESNTQEESKTKEPAPP